MSGSQELLRRTLGPAGADLDCEHSLELLDQLVEAELAGRDPRALFPEVATHLDACPDCREDHEGLRRLADGAAAGDDWPSPEAPPREG